MQHLEAFNCGEQNKLFRDKVAKTTQFLSKVLAEVCDDDHGKKSWTMLATNISMARRIYRWGQVSGSIEQLLKLFFNNKPISVVDFYKKVVLHFTYFLTQTFDSLCYIQMLLFRQKEMEFCTYYAQLFYFITCSIEFVDNFILSSRSGEEVETERRKLYQQIFTGILNCLRRVGDGLTAIRDILPEIFGPYKITVSMGGVTSGAISIYQSIPSLYAHK